MTSIMLDTNTYTSFKRGHSDIVAIIQQASQITLNTIVVGELLAGFANGSREAINKQELGQFLQNQRVRLLDIDATTAEYYATIYYNLKQKGRPIPTNDMWIAASAQQYHCELCTLDKHFSYIDSLKIGSTIAELL